MSRAAGNYAIKSFLLYTRYYLDLLSQSLLPNKGLMLLMHQLPCASVPDYQGT